jgi:hypothetical protein
MRNRLKGAVLALTLAVAGVLFVAPAALAETESTGADQFSDSSNVTAAQAASAWIGHCTAETEVAAMTAAGHALSTRVKVCGAWWSDGTSQETWAPVIRLKCFRDGVLFGSGTGGCRWKGSVSGYQGILHKQSNTFQVPSSSIPNDFWADSGRIWGSRNNYSASTTLKMCSDDWYWTELGVPKGNGVVHFKGLTGVDYGTFNMGNKCNEFNSSSH